MGIIQPKVVSKPWGHEIWISDGVRTPYATKKILFLAGNQTSLQVHEKKIETNYVLEGNGILLLSDEFFDCKLFANGQMSKEILNDHVGQLKAYDLKPGMIFDVNAGYLHRVIAITNLIFLETSTNELDDVYRIQDDTNRTHGRIQSEHQ